MRKLLIAFLTALAIVCAADEPKSFKTSLSCPNTNILSGDLITKICWSCVFPIRIAGSITVGGGAPPGASGFYKPTDQIGCVCTDELGVPHIGFTLSLWEPARLVELTRNPGCTTLFGIKFPFGLIRTTGFSGDASYDSSDQAFRNFHYYAFPLLHILDLLHKNRCYSDGFMGDIDLLYFSEMDPTWNNDELALLTAMESLIFSNPVALAACLVDSISSSAGVPQNALFWCAGTWGFMYPLSGNAQVTGASPRFTSLQAARAIFALHRRGLAHRTIGNDVLCRAKIHPFIVKSQYKLSMVYPLPEARKNHWIGETPYKWGIWRNYPGHGEDHVYLLWRWHDCCSSIATTD